MAATKRHLRNRWYLHVKMPFYGLVAQFWPKAGAAQKYLSNQAREKPHRRLVGTVGARTQPYDLILFGIINWHLRMQRPQQLCRQFARMGYRVFYVEPSFHHTPHPRLLQRGCSLVDSPAPNVFLCQLHCELRPPEFCRSAMGAVHLREFSRAIGNLRSAHGANRVVSLVEHPFWRPLVETLPGNLLIYDCLDYLPGFSHCTPDIESEEARLLAAADLVLASSAALMEKTAPFAQTVLVRNGVDFSFFSRKPATIKRPSNRPVVGYYGAIEDWFDIGLVELAAQSLPEWDFLLIGAATAEKWAAAKRTPNILLTGEVPYQELPAYLHGMDVCMIPFVENELTRCTNPVKVYEYLAAGKPVVATWMPELELMREHVCIARSPTDFIAALRAAMANPGTPEQVRLRRRWAASQDWSARFQQIDREVRRRLFAGRQYHAADSRLQPDLIAQ